MAPIVGEGIYQNPEPLSDQIAERDITERNEHGQNVVIVPAGKRIPVRLVQDKAVKPAETKKRRAAKRSEE